MIRAAICLLLAALVSACASDLDKRYLDSSLGENLELPPDLTRVEARSSFELPSNISGEDPGVRNRVPVLARVESLRLEGSGDHYWLSVEEPVDNLYQQVRSFWAAEGYRLVLDEPAIGIMQTEWILKEEGSTRPSSFWVRLFESEDLSATQDQFRTRIERDGNRSRIYIAHRGTEYRHVIQTGDRISPVDNEDRFWRWRRPEPELEIEMLSRLMIFLGLQQAEVEQQKVNVKLFAPRAFMDVDEDENSPVLVLKDPYHIAWNRVYHQLERLNFEIEKSEFKSGITGEGVFVIATDVVEEKKDGGGFFSFFSSKKKKKTKKFHLVVSEISHELTRINIENVDGDLDTTPAGAELMALLYEQIR